MSEFNDFLITALRERQSDNLNPDDSPMIVTWGGNDYPCCAGSQKQMLSLGIGGMAEGADLILIIIMDDLVPGFQVQSDLTGHIPVSKQIVTFQTKRYRIADTEIPPGLAFIALVLNDDSKGI